MVDLTAGLCDLPMELKVLVLSHIEHIETHHILALSSTFQEAFSLLEALDFEGVAGDVAEHLVRLLDDDRVRSLEKERALELIGVHQNRLCEYACVQRNFEVLKWARNELNLPWAQYPPGQHVSDDVLVLRMLREAWPTLKRYWQVNVGPEKWSGVTMENGRVVKLELRGFGLTGAVPAEVGRLSALKELHLYNNQLTSVPAEIGQLTSLEKLDLSFNQLTSVSAEIRQLTSLTELDLAYNRLTSVPAEIWQLTSLTVLHLAANRLTSVPAWIWQLTSLRVLNLDHSQLTSFPAEIGQLASLEKLYIQSNRLTSVPAWIWQLTSLKVLFLGDNQLTSLPAEIRQLTSLTKLSLAANRLTSVPAEIWQLTSLTVLDLSNNRRLTSLPSEIGQLTSLTELYLDNNQLWPDGITTRDGMSWHQLWPAAIRELRAAGCDVRSVDVHYPDEEWD